MRGFKFRVWMSGLAAMTLMLSVVPAQAGTNIVGRWHGHYDCGGLSEVWLDLRQDGRDIWGIFRFRAGSGETGSFKMSGKKSMIGGFLLYGREWIDQPANFVMIDLEGEVDFKGQHMNGLVKGPGCTGFELDRAD